MINVTKTYLPDIGKYKSYIDEIYANGQLTNNGPLVQKLERRLQEYLGVNNVILVANGTLALDVAYRALDLTGDVITTPFSFVATTSSIVSNGLNPLFVDINPHTFNIDPNLIEGSITSKISAIVAVHVFGNACEVEDIQKIAERHDLKVIYDAAHAFDVKYKDHSVLSYGDISTLSFHSTKLFHTIEGGALIIKDDGLANKVRRLINFGINNTGEIGDLGMNAKMNEFEAAMGLCVLDDMDIILKNRKIVCDSYNDAFSGRVQLQEKNNECSENYSYFPIVMDSESQLSGFVRRPLEPAI
jgi:dTDP-4-amino-4,6-dideoxygalactose transaminase